MTVQKTGFNKYVSWGLISAITVISTATYICLTNDTNENDLRFWLETILISLSINIFSSVIVMIFFDNRDAREKARRQKIVLRKLTGATKTMTTFLTQLQTDAALGAKYQEKTQRFIGELRVIEENYLFDLDGSLLESLEKVTLQAHLLEENTPKSVKDLTQYINEIKEKLNENK